MPKTRPPYPEEFRREAVALIRSGQRTLAEASESLGVSQQTLRNWLRQEAVDAGQAEGVTSEEREELSSALLGLSLGVTFWVQLEAVNADWLMAGLTAAGPALEDRLEQSDCLREAQAGRG